MNGFEAMILGLIQGLTEFLPVSSSGHLVIGRELLGIEAPEDIVFEVVVHAATVLSTIVVFRREIWALLKGLFNVKEEIAERRLNDETTYLLKIGVSMIPIFVVGMFFKDYIKEAFGNILVVGLALVVTALLLFLSDYVSRKRGEGSAEGSEGAVGAAGKAGAAGSAGEAAADGGGAVAGGEVSWLQAIVIGIAQAFAAIPGLSRSGTTIATGLLSGVKKEAVAQFSFLMVLVPILGEAFLEIVGGEMAASTTGPLALCIGFASAFISGVFACRVMIALVKRAQLKWFALYCAVVALVILFSSISVA